MALPLPTSPDADTRRHPRPPPAGRPSRHRAARRGDHPRASAATSSAAPSRPRAPADGRVVLRADGSSPRRRRPRARHRRPADRGAGGHRARRDTGASPPSMRRERGATYADVEQSSATLGRRRVSRPSVRELRAVLESIAELRRSRRLPELLRTAPSPARSPTGSSRGPTSARTAGSRSSGRRSRSADRVELVLDLGPRAPRRAAGRRVDPQRRHRGRRQQQREYLLRQQLAAIRKELGEGDDDVVDEYRTRSTRSTSRRRSATPSTRRSTASSAPAQQSPEQGWIRTWLDRVFELPWGVRSDDTIDLAAAQRILDDDHYGLDDVKERIVEFLAVRKLRTERGRRSTRHREPARPSRLRGATAPS